MQRTQHSSQLAGCYTYIHYSARTATAASLQQKTKSPQPSYTRMQQQQLASQLDRDAIFRRLKSEFISKQIRHEKIYLGKNFILPTSLDLQAQLTSVYFLFIGSKMFRWRFKLLLAYSNVSSSKPVTLTSCSRAAHSYLASQRARHRFIVTKE